MILSLISGFIFGILIGSFFHVTLAFFLILVILCFILFIYRSFVPDEQKKILIFCILVLVGVGAGFLRISFSNLYSSSRLSSFAGQTISAEGIVVNEPDVREHNTQLTIGLRSMTVASSTTTIHENIIVSVPLYPEFSYGDKVSLIATLVSPENIESDDGRSFDYQNYLRARGIWYVGKFPHIKYISSGHGSILKSDLFSIKRAFTESINRALPPPYSSLLGGLLIGSKQALGKEKLLEFSRAGVSHVVVLSGYNIAIVAESIMAALAFLPALAGFLIGCVSIMLFTIASGGGASAVRAAIMVLVALSAKKFGREYQAHRVLGFAVVLMLAHNPTLLVFDPSFQLSVLATIGLVFVSPHVSPFLSSVTECFGFRISRFSKTAGRILQSKVLGEIISSTIATQIIVLPFLIYNTGVLSLVSLPVNVLILGTIPLTMFLGFVTGIVGLFSLYLSFVPALPTFLLLWYQLTVVHLGATLPFGAVSLPAFSFVVLIGMYILIFSGLYFLSKRSQ